MEPLLGVGETEYEPGIEAGHDAASVMRGGRRWWWRAKGVPRRRPTMGHEQGQGQGQVQEEGKGKGQWWGPHSLHHHRRGHPIARLGEVLQRTRRGAFSTTAGVTVAVVGCAWHVAPHGWRSRHSSCWCLPDQSHLRRKWWVEQRGWQRGRKGAGAWEWW